MQTVVTFGELMLRLKPEGFLRFGQASRLESSFGGGEANVAASLARFGHNARWVSALPEGPIGDWALAELRKWGVDVSCVLRKGSRIGIYFLETGASQRASQVIYDRAGSAMSELDAGQLDWTRAFDGAHWLHTTGITPALSPEAARATREALTQAKKSGLTTSLDLNYRKKLWTPEQAQQVMPQLLEDTDVVVANEEDAAKVLGIRARDADVTGGRLAPESYAEVASQILERFPAVRYVGITLRESLSASQNGWSALLTDRDGVSLSRRYDISIVDRVGAGDSFGAGLIHAMLEGKPREEVVEFAAAASALKHTIVGDINLVSVAEVEALAAGDASGRVSR